MAETPCDNHDNTDPSGSNVFPPLVPIMANRLQGPSESDSQQGVVTGPSVTAENNNKNSSDVASTLQNVT